MLFKILRNLFNDPGFEAVFNRAVLPELDGVVPKEMLSLASNEAELATKGSVIDISSKSSSNYDISLELLRSNPTAERKKQLESFWINLKPLFKSFSLVSTITQQGSARKSNKFRMVVSDGNNSVALVFGCNSYNGAFDISLYINNTIINRKLIVTDSNFLVKYFEELLKQYGCGTKPLSNIDLSSSPSTDEKGIPFNIVRDNGKEILVYRLTQVPINDVVIDNWRDQSGAHYRKKLDANYARNYIKNVIGQNYTVTNVRKLLSKIFGRDIEGLCKKKDAFVFTDSNKKLITLLVYK